MRQRKSVLTEQELELMKIVWQRDSVTVRDVYESLLEHRKIAYTTVMTMMGILQEKGYVTKTDGEKAHVYRPAQPKQQVVNHLVSDFVERVFNGSAKPLLMNLVESEKLSARELDEISALLKRRAAK